MDILEFKDVKPVPDPVHPYTGALRESSVPIVIDNGSYHCRAGWASSPKPLLNFKNVLAKPRKDGKKATTIKKDAGEVQVGNDIANIEAVRFQLKTQFDRNIVTHMEVQELIFNYVFSRMGVNTEGCVPHPIVLTEAFLNPNYSRSLMSELLFECYNVPKVAYCVDSLCSYWRESPSPTHTSLIVNLGFTSSHVIPIINGQSDAKRSRRLDLGGQQLTSYMNRLLQLKYPVHVNSVNLSRAEELLHEHCHVASDYAAELNNWADPDYYDNHVKCIQLPFTQVVTLTPEQQKGRRRETARRLVEVNARKREEKLAEDEEQLNQLLAIQDMLDEGEEEEFQEALTEYGMNSADELQKAVGQLQARVERTRQKIANSMAGSMDEPVEEPKAKILKQMQQAPRSEEELKLWIEGLRKRREDLLEKRAARRQRRQDMAKRRTVASVERMRLISQLAADNDKKEDDFGRRDQDWDVYKAINREGDSDSEVETERLMELDEALRLHDPDYATTIGATEQRGGSLEATAESHRLHLAAEPIRVTEALFEPAALVGGWQAGLSETVAWVLSRYPHDEAQALARDVFLTGGISQLPGLKQRLLTELVRERPFQSEVNVRLAQEPSLGAWMGARDWVSSLNVGGGGDGDSPFLTRQEYEELGGEYFKEHSRSNPFNKTPPMPIVPLAGSNVQPMIVQQIEEEMFESSGGLVDVMDELASGSQGD